MANTLPTCVGFIMDGNRRFATEQGLSTFEGHKAGASKFFEIIEMLRELKIKHGVFYAFSTENWQRSELEVSYLIELFDHALAQVREVELRIIGERTRFSAELQKKMADLEEKSIQYQGGTTVWIALSYGGRAEILDAVQKAIAAGVPVDETSFRNLMWSAGMPDPDLIIRTGGDERLSNFLTWQSVYSELMFTPTYWPAFTKAEFTRMLAQYADRQRRYGT